MLFAASGLIGRSVAANNGAGIGAVKDFLLDDRRWAVRWLVVDAGHWLSGRKILIHPSAVAPIYLPPKPQFPFLSSGEQMAVSVNVTAQQVEGSPDAGADEPVTDELERRLFAYYGWDPSWGASQSGDAEGAADRASPDQERRLASAAELKGFAARGADDAVGSVDNVLIDDLRWTARSLVVATRGWLHGRLVQVPIHAVTGVDWQARVVSLGVPRERVDSAPVWDPLTMVDEIAEERVRAQFWWPGRGA
jgi:sporulation protein YlmC with PRC-barrel domain